MKSSFLVRLRLQPHLASQPASPDSDFFKHFSSKDTIIVTGNTNIFDLLASLHRLPVIHCMGLLLITDDAALFALTDRYSFHSCRLWRSSLSGSGLLPHQQSSNLH